MAIIGPACGINGCKKSKLRKHTHVLGELRGVADAQLIEQYRIYAQMTGQPLQIPGGMPSDMNGYMRQRLREGEKEAKKFRKKLADERKKK